MSNEIRLRNVELDDLPIFFEQQLDDEATRMADFPSRDRAAFDAHWAENILADPAATVQTIVVEGIVAGNVVSWCLDRVRFVGYWLGKDFWGRGIATEALTRLLRLVTERPIHAHVARHNVASIRVLEKCGFMLAREENGELVFVLHSDTARSAS